MPIVLLADRGTTGGYAKIATVITADMWRVVQLPSGGTVHFRAVTLERAHTALEEQEEQLLRIKASAPVLFFRRAGQYRE
jgi:antagonist of KipI